MKPVKQLLFKSPHRFYSIVIVLFILFLSVLTYHNLRYLPHIEIDSAAIKNSAYVQYRAGDYENAISSLNTYLELRPDDNSARNLLATSYIRLGRLESAKREIDLELKNTPNNSSSLLRAAHIATEQENYDLAIRYLQRAQKTAVDDGDMTKLGFQLAEVFTLLKNYDSAAKEWKTASRLLKRNDPRVPIIIKKLEDVYLAKELTSTATGNNTITGDKTVKPGMIFGFEAGDGENGQSTLTWSYTPYAKITAIRILRRDDGLFPTGPFDQKAVLVCEDTSHPSAPPKTAFTDTTGLSNSSLYHYAIFAKSVSPGMKNAWNDNVYQYINGDTAKPGPTVFVAAEPIETKKASQGQTGIALAALSLKTNFGSAKLNKISVRAFKNKEVPGLSKVDIFKDVDQNGKLSSRDIKMGSVLLPTSAESDSESDSELIPIKPLAISKKPTKLVIAGDIHKEADVRTKTGIIIEGAESIKTSGTCKVSRFPMLTAGPITITGNIVKATSSSTIMSTPRGRKAIVMQKLGLFTDCADAKLTALNISKTGTIADNKISSTEVYDDQNGNGKIDKGERRLGCGSMSNKKARVVFDEPQIITSKRRYFLITYDIMRNAQINKTVGSKILGDNGIEIEPPDRIDNSNNHGAGFSGKLAKIQASSEQISLVHNPPKNSSILQGKEDVILDRISISAPRTGDGAVVTGIRIDQIGTANDRFVSSVKLVDDNGKAGVYEPDYDKLLDKTRFKKGSTEFKISPNLAIDPGSSKNLLILADLSNEIKLNSTVQTLIAGQAYIKTSDPDKAGPFINAKGRIIKIVDKPDVLTVDQEPAGSIKVKVGSEDKLAQVINASVDTDEATFKGLRLRLTGSLDNSYVDDIKLWLDTNKNKKVDDGDRHLSTVTSFPKRMINFKNIEPKEVSSNKPVKLLVTCSISADAPHHKTFDCKIDNASDIDVAAPDKASIKKVPKRLSDTVITTLPQTPSAPKNIHATAKTDHKIVVGWDTNADKQAVTEYKVLRSKSKAGPFSQVGSVKTQTKKETTGYIDTVPNTGDFWYRVTAINESGESKASASRTTSRVEINSKVSTANSTATIKSTDNSLALQIPKSKAYDKKTFSAKSAIRPPGPDLKLVSEHYFEFDTDAKEPFDPPLAIMLKCDKPVDDSVTIYHYNKDGEWKPVAGGRYIYNGNYIGYTNITEFSGYGAAQSDTTTGYNDPPIYTEGPSGPHGGYINGSNKCKECHSVHLADGLYRLTRANERDEACDYCHGIGGLASTAIVLDEDGHDVADTASSEITAPDDTDPSYSVSTTKWGCLECHSAHANQTVELAGFSSDKLLKSNTNRGKTFLFYTPEVGETTQTVSQWCTSCHNASFGSSSDPITIDESTTVFGHSSSSTGMTTGGDGYAEVDPDDGVNKGPTCKQCHVADGRSDITTGFPHASGPAASLLDSDTASLKIDNACITCHNVSSLP